MCEKAEEIQKVWVQSIGDLFIYKKDIEKAFNWPGCFYFMIEDREYKNSIWLPTQEQLQEMINLDPITLIYLIDRFVAGGEGYWHSFAKAPYPDPSMNELWLAFVMKEKYNKSWTGKEWENETT